MKMILYHGSTKKFDHFHKETVVQNFEYGINTIGFWFTSKLETAKPYAIGTETVIEKSKTEFWPDGESKVVQIDRQVQGYIYKVFLEDEINLKEYNSTSGDSFGEFMKERDQYCDYLTTKRKNMTWKDKGILLNKEEANETFRKHLIKQGYEGFVIMNADLENSVTDLYCIFSEKALYISDVIPVDVKN
jgi:hypothetical protein